MLTVLAGCGASGQGGVSKGALIRAQVRVGIRVPLATCIANAASLELSVDDLRIFLANPSDPPPALSQRVTLLAADCAIEVAAVPSTGGPSTTPSLSTPASTPATTSTTR